MTWTKLDDDFPDRDAIFGLSDAAFRLHVSGLCHSNRLLTDGHLAAAKVPNLVPHFDPATVDELVAAGVWARTPDGYLIVDSLSDQPTRDQVEARRASDRQRQSRRRGGESQRTRHGVTNGVSHGGSHATPDPTPSPAGREGHAGVREAPADPDPRPFGERAGIRKAPGGGFVRIEGGVA